MDVPPILARIGNTPLIELWRTSPHAPRVRILAKCEFANPSGSVKDRAAWWMVQDGLRSGELSSGREIVEASSGNTGIALAMIGAVLGIRVTIVMPTMASHERKRLLAAYGARHVATPPEEGQDGAILRAREMAKEDPGRWWYPDQYSHPANVRAHYESTGPEIWRDTGGGATHLVCGLGTGGTATGTGRFLRERSPAVRIVGVEPDSGFHGIEGLKHMASSLRPAVFDERVLTDRATVRTEDAYEHARRLARQEGIFAGPSSGAVLAASLRLAASLPPSEQATVVAILADGGLRYLSTRTSE